MAQSVISQTAERRSQAQFGSDLIVEMLRELRVPYVALNPGASFRGLHDSLVNFQQGEPPGVILCTHEEIAVAIAHGYARAAGQPMAAALHNVVGLQHGTMAIFNAWCDRTPVIVLGGTGPMDASKRRAHIDWVHTALVQGNQVRDYVKWDDQPGSVAAIGETMLRGYRIAMTEPQGPVYLCFDVEHQEERITAPLPLPDVKRFAPAVPPAPNPESLRRAARALVGARWPIIIAEGAGKDASAVASLVELAELLGAGVIDRGARFNFPSTHPLDLSLCLEEALRDADVVLALDVNDLGGVSPAIPHDRETRKSAIPGNATVIHVTLGDMLTHSWAADYQILPEVDIPIAADTSAAIPALLSAIQAELSGNGDQPSGAKERAERVHELNRRSHERMREQIQQAWGQSPISHGRLYSELWQRIRNISFTLVNTAGRLPARAVWELTRPEQFLGNGGRGGGLGYGLPGSIGAALALKESGRLCIGIICDGDFMMTSGALWTAARYRIPLLAIVYNNKAYYQDYGHQTYMARSRERSLANVGIGLDIDDPDINFAALANSLGVEGFGRVDDPDKLGAVLDQAIKVVQSGRPALVDVYTQPR